MGHYSFLRYSPRGCLILYTVFAVFPPTIKNPRYKNEKSLDFLVFTNFTMIKFTFLHYLPRFSFFKRQNIKKWWKMKPVRLNLINVT
jgi:hypothetical protein